MKYSILLFEHSFIFKFSFFQKRGPAISLCINFIVHVGPSSSVEMKSGSYDESDIIMGPMGHMLI